MRGRRGLTLVEVLASTLLLALLAAAVVPIVRQATAAIRERGSSLELFELGEFADAWLAAQEAERSEAEPPDVPWPDDPPRLAVTVQRLTAADADHAWVVFSCDGWVAARWLPLEPSEDRQQEEPSP